MLLFATHLAQLEPQLAVTRLAWVKGQGLAKAKASVAMIIIEAATSQKYLGVISQRQQESTVNVVTAAAATGWAEPEPDRAAGSAAGQRSGGEMQRER